ERDPCVLPRGTLKKAKGAGTKRLPYSKENLIKLITGAKTPDARVWNALAIFTGMREGEVCGRRWRDWDRDSKPLGSLMLTTQYDDQPLKMEDETGDQPRVIPVHPTLAALLEWWWREGWEFVFLRKPTPDDFIVPRRGRGRKVRVDGN